MKKLFLFSFLLIAGLLQAQFVNKGTVVTIQSGTVLSVPDDVRNIDNGKILNQGKLVVRGNLQNISGDLQGGGIYRITGNFDNFDNFQADTSVIIFEGTASNLRTSGDPVYRLRIELDNGQQLFLIGDAQVLKQLQFASDQTYVAIQNNSLYIGSIAAIQGYDQNNYVLTSGSGKLWKQGDAGFVFPVGHSLSDYTPFIVNKQNSAGSVGVRALERAYEGGLSGPQLAQAIRVSWDVMVDPSTSLSLATAQWNPSDEPSLFDRQQSALIHHDGNAWETDPPLSPANGGGPYTQNRSNPPGSGVYTVTAKQLDPDAVPTMGEWAFLLFGLVVFNLMVVGVWNLRGEEESRLQEIMNLGEKRNADINKFSAIKKIKNANGNRNPN